MTEVKITGVNIRRNPKANATGTRVLAYFDCEARGFVIAGCALAVTEKNGLTVWPPKLNGKDDPVRRLSIADDSLRHAMMSAAKDAYKLMGGEDLPEWAA